MLFYENRQTERLYFFSFSHFYFDSGKYGIKKMCTTRRPFSSKFQRRPLKKKLLYYYRGHTRTLVHPAILFVNHGALRVVQEVFERDYIPLPSDSRFAPLLWHAGLFDTSSISTERGGKNEIKKNRRTTSGASVYFRRTE